DRGGRLGKAQQALGAELTVLVGEVAVLDELRTDRDTGLSQHGVVSLDTLTGGDRVLRAAEHPDAAMAEVQQVLDRCAAADRKSTRLNSSHVSISYAVFCLKKTK